MNVNREGYKISKDERECTKCGIMFPLTSKTVTLCNKCNSDRVKCMSPESKMYQRAKCRAKSKNLDFNIDKSDIIIPTNCPILGVELICKSGSPGGDKSSPALDRINPNEGYIKGNIRVISHLANMMKSHANDDELLKFSKWVIENISKDSD